MASLLKDRTGRWQLQFTTPDKRRRTLRLGKIAKRDAESVKSHVEAIIASAFAGHSAPDDTCRWLSRLPEALHQRLAASGLCRPRDKAALSEFIDRYVASRQDLKPLTVVKFKATQDYLVEFFGAECDLRAITPGTADDWRLWLIGKQLGENTIRKHTQIVKQFFTAAVRKQLVPQNPFADLRSATLANPKRFYFVTEAEAEAVLAACPDHEWRLLFALSRYGGLRCPSEHLSLRWGDIDWERGRMTVHSPKTEHHVGHASRVVPIFPELRPHLDEAFALAPDRAEFVITRYRDRNSNLRTQLTKIIQRAGLNPWPKLFHNLRSTRQTELEERFPSHVVCAWIGNSRAVATKHYLQVTDEHFEKAAAPGLALQNPTHTPSEIARNGSQADSAPPDEPLVFPAFATGCIPLQPPQIAEAGLEPARE